MLRLRGFKNKTYTFYSPPLSFLGHFFTKCSTLWSGPRNWMTLPATHSCLGFPQTGRGRWGERGRISFHMEDSVTGRTSEILAGKKKKKKEKKERGQAECGGGGGNPYSSSQQYGSAINRIDTCNRNWPD